MRRRYNLIDTIRAIVIILMVFYHLLYDLVFIYHFNLNFFGTTLEKVLQLTIGLTFIMISAFCVHLSHNNYKRGIKLIFFNFVIMLVTLIFLPNNPIYYGILFCIGTCIIITSFVKKYLDKINPVLGLIIFLLLFLLSYNIDQGTLNVFFKKITIPPIWYNNYTTFIGLSPKGFYSSDYYPILPYLNFFIASYYLFIIVKKHQEKVLYIGIAHLEKIGKYSLEIYLGHQVVIYLILFIILGV